MTSMIIVGILAFTTLLGLFWGREKVMAVGIIIGLVCFFIIVGIGMSYT